MSEFQVTFWTESGGCSRCDKFKVQNIKEVQDLIFQDLKDASYINFWYGQYIDIKNLNSGEKFHIKTHDKKGPIRMKIFIDGEAYESMKDLEEVYEASINREIEDEDDDDIDFIETITMSLFEGKIVETSDDMTYLKLEFCDENNTYEILLEFKINWDFLLGSSKKYAADDEGYVIVVKE